MDSTIIAALITACSSALWYAFGLLKKDSGLFLMRFKLSKEILYEQLVYVYEPLIKILDNTSEPKKELVSASSAIFDKHYSLIPNELKETIQMLSCGSDLDNKQFEYLFAFVQSNYNWAKKVLGYPFDPAQIDKSFLPRYNHHQSSKQVFSAFFGGLVSVVAMIFPVLFWAAELSDEAKSEIIPLWVTVLEYISGICFFGCALNELFKIRKRHHQGSKK